MTSLRRGDSVSAKPTREDTTAVDDIDHLAGMVATNVGSKSKDVGMSEYMSEELQNSHYF